MIFKKQESAQQLIDLQKDEQKKMAQLEKKLASVKSEWTKFHDEAALAQALYDGHAALYRGPKADANALNRNGQTYETFFEERERFLQQQVEVFCGKRDALTFEIVVSLRYFKEALFQRQSIIAGDFGSFCSAVADHRKNNGSVLQCDPSTREMILGFRKAAEGIQDMGALLSYVREKVEEIEALENLQHVPLFRLDDPIMKALAVASAPKEPESQKFATIPEGYFDTKGPGLSY